MIVLRRALAFAFLAVLLPVAVQAAEKRVALVIGNQAYPGTPATLRPLNNPKADAERLAALLQQNGFEVLSCDGKTPGCFDLTREKLNDALDDLKAASKDADLALLFYAGHGLQIGEGNVLAPIDMELKCGDAAARRGVVLATVLEAMKDAKQKIVVMDACRNDPMPQCPQRGALALSFGSFALPDAESLMLVASTKPGQVAQDGLPGTHSPFARALFHWLEQGPTLPFDQLFGRVAKTVMEETRKANFTQVPERLVRGIAPSHCLKGNACSADPDAARLHAEVERLQTARARDQDLLQIATAYLEKIGVRGAGTRALSAEERQRAIEGLSEAGRALVARRDDKGEAALQKLRDGSTEEAEKLFQETLQRERQAATERRGEAAKAARHLAALAKPKDVVRAAGYLKEALELEPQHAETWFAYGEAARAAGRTEDAKRAFATAAGQAHAESDVLFRVKAYYRLSEVTAAQGNLVEARRLAETARAAAKAWAAAAPANSDALYELGAANIYAGDIEREQGDLDAALASYAATRSLRAQLAAKDPSNATWQRGLATANNRMGGIAFRQGRMPEALERFTTGLAIRERLLKADPANVDAQFEAAYAHLNVGDVLVEQGDLPGALQRYEASRAMRQDLVAADPGNLAWQRELAASHNRIGGVSRRQGRLEVSLEAFRAGLALRERLAVADQEDRDAHAGVAWSHFNIGDVLRDQGSLDAALDSYRAALALRERLTRTDPSNARWQLDHAATYERIGTMLLALKKPHEALSAFQFYHKSMERLVASNPSNAMWQHNLAISHNKIGDVRSVQAQLVEALESYKAAHGILDRIVAGDPSNTRLLREMAASHARLGRNHERQNNRAEALRNVEQELAILERLTLRDQSNAEWQTALGAAQGKVARLKARK